MKVFFALLILGMTAQAHAADSITPCLTEVVKTPSGFKSYEVQLVASDTKGYHMMKIIKNEGAVRSELPSVAIYFKSEAHVSKMVSVETREDVMAYRETVSPTREGAVKIIDGTDALQLKMTCYL